MRAAEITEFIYGAAMGWKAAVRFPAKIRHFSLFCSIRTGPTAQFLA
jgi:hypothetical protein